MPTISSHLRNLKTQLEGNTELPRCTVHTKSVCEKHLQKMSKGDPKSEVSQYIIIETQDCITEVFLYKFNTIYCYDILTYNKSSLHSIIDRNCYKSGSSVTDPSIISELIINCINEKN
jgi:hypothetical protein